MKDVRIKQVAAVAALILCSMAYFQLRQEASSYSSHQLRILSCVNGFGKHSVCGEAESPPPTQMPVIYVIYGHWIPPYFELALEVSALNNPVVVLLADIDSATYAPQWHPNVRVEALAPYSASADEFQSFYWPPFDVPEHRKIYERNCFLRWFVLKDYMEKNNLSRAYYGDGDNVLFTSAETVFDTRMNCSAIINVQPGQSALDWLGAGESSIWTVEGIRDFTAFTLDMYRHNNDTLLAKETKSGQHLVDMSLLWLWWTANRGAPSSFKYSLSPANRHLKLCNGMDVVASGKFDHRHASKMPLFNFNGRTSGVPSVGHVSVYNVHYQGAYKSRMANELCAYLYERTQHTSDGRGEVAPSPSSSAASSAGAGSIHSNHQNTAASIRLRGSNSNPPSAYSDVMARHCDNATKKAFFNSTIAYLD